MPVHWTRDHLAVLVVAVFLVWLGSSVFVPIPYFLPRGLLWGPGGGRLLGSTFLLALACFWTYVVAGSRLPSAENSAPPEPDESRLRGTTRAPR